MIGLNKRMESVSVTDNTMLATKGGVDVVISPFNIQKKI